MTGDLSPPGQLPALFAQGADAVLIRFADALSDAANRAALRAAAEIERRPPPGTVEIASALVSVIVRFDPGVTDHSSVAQTLRSILMAQNWDDCDLPANRTRWHVPVAFGGNHGPALASVAKEAGVSEAQAIADITGQDLRVLALGFAPGQPYLGFLPDVYDLPRQTDLTPQVPASSLVLAVRQIVLFANAAPTGWRQVGQSHLPCCRPELDNPVLLSPGDEVRFHAVGHGEFDALADTDRGGAKAETLA